MKPKKVLKRIRGVFDTTMERDDGTKVSSNAYYNLEGALHDIERNRGVVDVVSMNTLKRIAGQLATIDVLLEQYEQC